MTTKLDPPSPAAAAVAAVLLDRLAGRALPPAGSPEMQQLLRDMDALPPVLGETWLGHVALQALLAEIKGSHAAAIAITRAQIDAQNGD